jgi:hypothetical protein
MTKVQAQTARDQAVEAVKDAQMKCAKSIGVEKSRAKAELAVRLQELAEAKLELKRINAAASGLAPIEAKPRDTRPPTTEELATILLETFQRLLILDPNHVAIITLRNHFAAERPSSVTVLPDKRLRPEGPVSPVKFLDVQGRRAQGAGANLYPKNKSA